MSTEFTEWTCERCGCTMSTSREERICMNCMHFDGTLIDPQPCVICGEPFYPRTPNTPHCASCHYSRVQPDQMKTGKMAPLFAAFARRGIVLDTWHSGGGCYHPALYFDNERALLWLSMEEYFYGSDEDVDEDCPTMWLCVTEYDDDGNVINDDRDEECGKQYENDALHYCAANADAIAEWAAPIIREAMQRYNTMEAK